LLLLVLGLLTAITVIWRSGHSQAQSPELRVVIRVSNAALPVTIGVPLAESASLLDASQLAVTDPGGAPVPAQARVLARWQGLANDTTKPIKWALLDFKPTVAGAYTLTRTPEAVAQPVLATSDSASAVRVATSRLEIEVPKQGASLLSSFKLDGAETLRAPFTVQGALPRGAIVVATPNAADSLLLGETTLLNVGAVVRFEHLARIKWDASAGSTQVVTEDSNLIGSHSYLIAEGTPRQEEIAVTAADAGALTSSTPLKFDHAAGSTIRDLSVEQDPLTIQSIDGQLVRFSASLKQTHAVGDRMYVAGAGTVPALATIDKTSVEEANSLRVVVRQDGHFYAAATRVMPTVNFTLRYHVYADQPFIRVRWRLNNDGPFGFGASRLQQPPYAQHALIRSLAAVVPTAASGSGYESVLNAADAHARVAHKQSSVTMAAGSFEISVPEFAENFPKAVTGAAEGLRFDVLPDVGNDYLFDGARSKTTDFYLGRSTAGAVALSNSMNAGLEPAYIAQTGAVRPAFIEKRNWSSVFSADPQMGEAADRAERLLACSYAVEASDSAGSVPPVSIFEYRERGEYGEHFGWRNFGDLAWAEGYSNLHYDLPYILLREYLRTGDGRAFRIGGEMARYRSDWGQYHANDYWDVEHTYNLRGLAFYEKGDHGTYREPVPSHTWVEGLWLYWALTGDEAAHESALEGSEALARFQFTYDNALSWNEPRWVGWPVLGLMAAWRYSGNGRYLYKAKENTYLLMQAEIDFGRKGYYLPDGMTGEQNGVKSWMWAGYSMLGVIEYWRETNDQNTAAFLVRVADWLINRNNAAPNNPPLVGGYTNPDGSYRPHGAPYVWYPHNTSPDSNGSVEIGVMDLPVLVAAARISNREDIRAYARGLFRDAAFYRDFAEGTNVSPASRAVINFHSLLYPMTSPKAYGQTGLTISEYLPDLLGSVVTPRTAPAIPTPTPVPSSVPGTCHSSTAFAGLTNAALNRPASASSVHLWGGATCTANTANDGLLATSDGRASFWHSESNTGRPEWWQVDLGQPTRIGGLEILFRQDQNQESTRRNFEVCASNDASFVASTILAGQGSTPAPFQQTWQAAVNDPNAYRYVRVRKTSLDPDDYGDVYFNLVEVRVYAAEASASPASAGPLSLGDLTPRALLVGQALNLTLAREDRCGQPLQLSATGLPENASFDAASGVFSFIPAAPQAGNVYQVTFQAGYGQTSTAAKLDIAVMIGGAPRVTVLTPKATDHLIANRSITISWSADAAAQVASYQIKLSTDGGATYPTVIAELPGSAQQYQWAIPPALANQRSSQVRLMVVASDAEHRVGVDSTHYDLRFSRELKAVSAASYRGDALAAGSINTIFGTQMTTVSWEAASSLPLPFRLGGTEIEVLDSQGILHPAPLFYVGHIAAGAYAYDQINFYLPEDVAAGEAVITVTSAAGDVSEDIVQVRPVAPALFTTDASGSGEVVMISTIDGVSYASGAVKQDAEHDVYLILFGTGWRYANGTNLSNSWPVVVEINHTPVQVLYAGAQGGFVGLDQINLLLPRDLAPGVYPLTVRTGHQVSNTAQLRVF